MSFACFRISSITFVSLSFLDKIFCTNDLELVNEESLDISIQVLANWNPPIQVSDWTLRWKSRLEFQETVLQKDRSFIYLFWSFGKFMHSRNLDLLPDPRPISEEQMTLFVQYRACHLVVPFFFLPSEEGIGPDLSGNGYIIGSEFDRSCDRPCSCHRVLNLCKNMIWKLRWWKTASQFSNFEGWRTRVTTITGGASPSIRHVKVYL